MSSGDTSFRWSNVYSVNGNLSDELLVGSTPYFRANAAEASFFQRLYINTSGQIYPINTSTRTAGMYGVYDPAKIGHIWSMGTAFQIADDGSSFGNLYGLAYVFDSDRSIVPVPGHQAVWVHDGVPKSGIGEQGLWTTGSTTTPKIFINRSTAVASGISWYSSGYNSWQTYMSSITDGSGVNGNITPVAGTYVTGWALRNTIEPTAGFGWTWESLIGNGTSPTIVAELSSNTGNFKTKGLLRGSGFYKEGSSDSYVLTGGGGHATISSLNVTSATRLATARTLWGQSFDGSSNISGNMTGIGSMSVSGTITTGAGMNVPYSRGQWLSMATRSDVIAGNENQSYDSAHALYTVKNSNGDALSFGGLDLDIGFHGFYASRIAQGINGVDWQTYWNVSDGTLTHAANFIVRGDTWADGRIRGVNWFESIGNTGWFNGTYGGGWFMQDPTYLRVYGDKRIHSDCDIDAFNGKGDGNAAFSIQGGISAKQTIWAGGQINSNAGFYQTSDERSKSNIKKVDTSIAKKIEFKQYIKNDKQEIGVIAQQVLQHMPDAVTVPANSDEMLQVNYHSVLSAKCAQYEEEITELRKELTQLKNIITKWVK